MATELISLEGPEAHAAGHPSPSFFEIQGCEAHLQARPGRCGSFGNRQVIERIELNCVHIEHAIIQEVPADGGGIKWHVLHDCTLRLSAEG